MKDYSYINDISKADDLRLYVIEHALHIEKLASETIGYILGIDWKNSKSFGNGSTALSFNQKIQIIQDLKGLDKIDIQKFSDFMGIRNKFAHVLSIKTFDDFFNSGKNGADVKKNLIKYYGFENSEIDEGLKNKIYFYRLFSDLLQILTQKIAKHEFERGKKAFTSEYLLSVLSEVGNLENGDDVLKKAFKKVDPR
ncbi:hypothetical protein [Flavobacterium magnum]|uniref:hypothetical protein n=1 Tax=Flavobacterium magnum TaxID=2162713 RepID=UPI0011B254D3|nr:hypothetical protein [Flavobacterium magnum]